MCTELRLYATLRYLGGGSVHDIRRALKTKKTSTYAIINQVCKAIIQCPALEVKFSQTQIECQEAAMGFRSISHDEAIDNCVAAIDGYLLHTDNDTTLRRWNLLQVVVDCSELLLCFPHVVPTFCLVEITFRYTKLLDQLPKLVNIEILVQIDGGVCLGDGKSDFSCFFHTFTVLDRPEFCCEFIVIQGQ